MLSETFRMHSLEPRGQEHPLDQRAQDEVARTQQGLHVNKAGSEEKPSCKCSISFIQRKAPQRKSSQAAEPKESSILWVCYEKAWLDFLMPNGAVAGLPPPSPEIFQDLYPLLSHIFTCSNLKYLIHLQEIKIKIAHSC